MTITPVDVIVRPEKMNIQAVQLAPFSMQAQWREVADWVRETARQDPRVTFAEVDVRDEDGERKMFIQTLTDGRLFESEGGRGRDWVLRGQTGLFTVVSRREFAETYLVMS